MKTKLLTNKTFEQLIKDNNFTYVYSYCPKTLPKPERFSSDFKVYKYDRYITTQEVFDDMKRDGYVPANAHELLSWFKQSNDNQWTVALDASSVFQDRRGHRCFLYVGRDGDANRGLSLGLSLTIVGFGAWDDGWAFLAVKSSDTQSLSEPPDTLTLESLENLSLEYRVKSLENDMEKIKKFLII